MQIILVSEFLSIQGNYFNRFYPVKRLNTKSEEGNKTFFSSRNSFYTVALP